MPSTFDLFRNPFVLLGLDVSASAKDVADAYEDAVADGRAAATELNGARQALLKPLPRLEAEIRTLLDIPRQDWRAILTALKSSQTSDELRQVFSGLPPISRSNLLAHAGCHKGVNDATLRDWIAAQSSIQVDHVYTELQNSRKKAGVGQADRSAISVALDDLKEEQSRALLESIEAPADAIPMVSSCTTALLAEQNADHIATLAALINAYGRYVEQELSLRRERIKSAAEALRSEPDGPGNLALLVDAIQFWERAGEPLQLMESHKGRDEPHAQVVFQEVRSLAIDLANNVSRFDIALSITRACQEIFSKLPRATEQLTEDERLLEERSASAHLEPLAAAIGALDSDYNKFANDLRVHGFGTGAVDKVKLLREALITAVRNAKEGAPPDVPWLMARSVALKLNNELELPESALSLTKGLLDLSTELGASEDIRAKFREDKRAVDRNLLEKRLLAHLNAGRLGEALSAVAILLQDYKSPEERDNLQKLKSTIERKRMGQYVRWGFWPAIAAIGLIISTINKSSTPTYQSAPSSYTQGAPTHRPVPTPFPQIPPPARPISPDGERFRNFTEERPPVGQNWQFSEGNIRYCMYQEVRLNFVKSRTESNVEIREFNQLVDDYNSRCSSYRYRPSERSAVEAELTEKRSELEEQGKKMLDGWRTRDLPSVWSPPAPPPATGAPAPPPPVSVQVPAAAPPIATSTAAPSPAQTNDTPILDLLHIDDAARVQGRLIQLGYLKGTADGTWGPQSRSALRAFRAASGLPASDTWDSAVAERLFSPSATRSAGGSRVQNGLPDAIFPPPLGATMNPLNREDAIRIHGRLRELGFYLGRGATVWSLTSRAALKEFKARNGLTPDDQWDAMTEQRLFSPVLASSEDVEDRFLRTFGGTWATDVKGCPGSTQRSNVVPLTITRRQAKAGDDTCDFSDIRSIGDKWALKAQCHVDGQNQTANVSLVREGNQMTWSSEHPPTTYFRCGS